MPKPPTRTIAFLAFERFQLLDITGPLQAFASAAELADPPVAYRTLVLSKRGGLVASSSGLGIETQPLAAAGRLAIDTLIVPGGAGVHAAARDSGLRDWVALQAAVSRRAGSVCTGAFLVAAAGLLDGCAATTHWDSCELLAKRFPQLRVEPDAIFVRQGKIFTSAGVTAGIDLALALIEEDRGRALSMRVARQLVVYARRPGGQSQFSEKLRAQTADDGTFDALHHWIASNLGADLSVEALAARAGMSPRHFARVYRARTGLTPARAVARIRLEAARRQLEDTPARIGAVADAAGFTDPDRLRRVFRRHLGVSPRAYRSGFAGVSTFSRTG
jgi:transcriptional regulator GlxA family with amidase domain